ncbi:hypothetical protein RDI58_013610 [Solanum bulbocastanum]|uniref:Uncharacterized protein n=1 Tax=Solanum bulbocastanum TaxID=147425 RepID=A0AAN8TMI5_SOLBU
MKFIEEQILNSFDICYGKKFTDVIISGLQSHLNLVLLDSWLTHLDAKTLFFPGCLLLWMTFFASFKATSRITLRDRGPYPPDQGAFSHLPVA